jgi:hypothetical protein
MTKSAGPTGRDTERGWIRPLSFFLLAHRDFVRHFPYFQARTGQRSGGNPQSQRKVRDFRPDTPFAPC